MKKRKFQSEKPETPEKVSGQSAINQDELLDLDSLLDVQGGVDDKDRSAACGLGCFGGSTFQQQGQTNDGNKSK